MKALQYNISEIVIGNNKGWKQGVSLGKHTNQTFVSIPFARLIQMLTYKAQQVGIEVIVVEESYTSGTSYIDNETPVKDNYDKSRREYRGLFVSNKGIAIVPTKEAVFKIASSNGQAFDVNIASSSITVPTRITNSSITTYVSNMPSVPTEPVSITGTVSVDNFPSS